MGAKTKEVGGGSAAPVANEFNNFLMQQLTGQGMPMISGRPASPIGNSAIQGGMNQQQSNAQQPFQQTQQAAVNMTQGFGAGGGAPQNYSGLQSNQDFMSNVDPNDPRIGTPEFQQYMSARQNAVQGQGQAPQMSVGGQQQTQSGFQGAFNNALSGRVNDISGAGGALQNFFNNPSAGNLSLPQFQNQYTAPQFQNANVSQLGTNFGAGQTGMADLSKFGTAAQSNFNTAQGMGGQGDLSNFLSSMRQQGAPQAAAGQANIAGPESLGARPELGQGLSFDAAKGMANNMPFSEIMRQRAIADQNARFGAEGAGSLGTGAQFANATLNADYAARTDQEGLNRALQLMGQDLNERSTGANVSLAGRGQDSQYNLGNRGMDAQLAAQNAQLQTQASMGNASNAIQNNSNILQGLLNNRGMDISQLGLGSQQSMFNAGQQNNVMNNMMQGTIQNQGLGNAFGLNAATLNNNAQQANNANSINQSQFQNNFNQGNAQNFANFGQANNSLNSQNQINQQQINNQMLQSMINSGMNMNQLGNQNTMGMLAQLFGGFGQSNALGTAQRQTVTQPSALGQALNMGTQLFGSYLAGGGRIPGFGGGSGGGIPSLPGGGPQIGLTPSGNQSPFGGIGSYQAPMPVFTSR